MNTLLPVMAEHIAGILIPRFYKYNKYTIELMGLLRFLLALSIVIFHINPDFQPNLFLTRLAVPTFFIISGFYISLVLRRKYLKKKNYYWEFIKKRILRIYPAYLFVLSSFFVFSLVKYFFHLGNGSDNAIIHLLNAKTNIYLYLLGNITLLPLGSFWSESDKSLGFLIGPQIWAIQVELLFYTIAPFLLNLKNRVLTFVLGSISIIIFVFDLPTRLKSVPVLSLFVSHLVYFFIGIVGYLIITRWRSLDSNSISGWNKLLGRLSYPVFVSHVFFIKLAKNMVHTQNLILFSLVVIVITSIISFLIIKFIENPILRFYYKTGSTGEE